MCLWVNILLSIDSKCMDYRAYWVAQLIKDPSAMQENLVQFLGQEDPLGEGIGYPLQYSGLKNSMDCIVHGAAKSGT